MLHFALRRSSFLITYLRCHTCMLSLSSTSSPLTPLTRWHLTSLRLSSAAPSLSSKAVFSCPVFIFLSEPWSLVHVGGESLKEVMQLLTRSLVPRTPHSPQQRQALKTSPHELWLAAWSCDSPRRSSQIPCRFAETGVKPDIHWSLAPFLLFVSNLGHLLWNCTIIHPPPPASLPHYICSKA